MTTATTRVEPHAGRPAVQELAELLLLRRRPAAVAIGGVLLAGLLLALLGAIPATPLLGLVVGLVALLVALGAMLATDAIDPVVRGPRHVRVSGRTVLGRVPAAPLGRDLRAPVDQLVAALQRTRHLRVVVVGVGHDARPVAEGLARGTAAAGHSALLVDCGDMTDGHGISDAGGDGLARVVRIDEQIRMATTGAGSRPDDAIAAAARLAATPPSDLDLLVTVLPDGAYPPAGLLAHTERLVAVVPLDVLGRDELDRRLSQVEGSRSTSASVVVVDLAPTGRPTALEPQPAHAVGDEADVAHAVGDEDAVAEDAVDAPSPDERPVDEPPAVEDREDEPTAGVPAVATESEVQTGAVPTATDRDTPLDSSPAVDAASGDEDGPPPFRGIAGAAAAAATTVGDAASGGAGAVRSALASLAGRVDQRAAHRTAEVPAVPDQHGDAAPGEPSDVATTDAGEADGPAQIVDVTDDATGGDPDDTAPLELPTVEHDDDLALRTAAALEHLAEDSTVDR